jgi:predicted AlkP superfamily pyrophosphatase or phosphodiesterase
MTDCKNNHCPPVQQETVLEHVKRSMGLQKKEVAAFASWEGLSSAVAMNKEQITHGIFPGLFQDEFADQEMINLQQKAMLDLPKWKESRKDIYTFELGMQYLKKHCPRLLYISLVDSDEFGHAKDYPGYVNSLRTYDDYIDQIIQTLKRMGEYGKQTSLIVTTDHSRGKGPLWIGHAITPDSEKNVFLFAHGRGVKSVGRSNKKAGHQNIRPTIEYLMGLAPTGEILPNIKVD